MSKLVILSDTHEQGRKIVVPDGDILIHCGDLTYRGTVNSIAEELNWFTSLPHKYKIYIAGNHDFSFQDYWRKHKILEEFSELIYLEDSGCEINGIKFWGSPVQPFFFNWAFQKHRGDALRKHWEQIPEGIDVLITHGPPKGFGDINHRDERFGDEDLLNRVLVVKPKYHVYGHAHHGYGRYENADTQFLNCASCTEEYKPTNPPMVFEC